MLIRAMWLVAILSVGIVALLATFWVMQRRMMYLPFGAVTSPEAAGLPSARTVTLETADGLSLGAWLVPPAGPPRATVIVFNGNAGNRSHRARLAANLSHAGFEVLLFDYRGFGGNAGAPSEDGLIADARAAREFVRGSAGSRPDRLVYFGESLGSGVAVALAVEHPPAALILRSPFASAVDVARFHYPWLPVGWIMKDRFPSMDRIARVTAPAFFVAGDRDSIVPASQTRALFDRAPGRKELFVIAGADHNDADLAEGPEMIARASAFVNAVLESPTAAPEVSGALRSP